MPGRTTPLINGEFYHIFNRGSDKRDIFLQPRDFKRFQKTFFYYHYLGPKQSYSGFSKSDLSFNKPDLSKKLVDIICYCLMPNHFHFLVRQLRNNGISTFISQLSNSYTKYFNTKYKRLGALLQGSFKAVLVEKDEQLIHVSRYIHLNPVVSGVVKKLENYSWSSYSEYINKQEIYCSTKEILNFYPSAEKYKEFVEAQIDYGSTLEILKHKTIDTDEY